MMDNERGQCCCSGVAVEVRSFSDDCRTLYDIMMCDCVDFHRKICSDLDRSKQKVRTKQ